MHCDLLLGAFTVRLGEKGAKRTFLILTEMLFIVALVLTHTRGLPKFPMFWLYLSIKNHMLVYLRYMENKGCSPDGD